MILNKLSWREPKEVNNLDTALVSLGYTYHIDTVPGIEGEVYVIDNINSKKGRTFLIKKDDTFGVYGLYSIKPVWEHSFVDIKDIERNLQEALLILDY